MVTTTPSPCTVFFDALKKYVGISYKETASLILSDKARSGSASPLSRATDRTWLSRYIVNAPVDAINESYFADFDKSALRLLSRVKSSKKKALSDMDVLSWLSGPIAKEMTDALRPYNDDAQSYANMLERLSHEGEFTESERTEIAMVLFLSAGCTASVEQAIGYAMQFAVAIHGGVVKTPLITPNSTKAMFDSTREEVRANSTLGLMRTTDNYVMGSPHWLCPNDSSSQDCDVEIGSLATGKGSISDVAPDVSGSHLHVFRRDGQWYVRDLGSKNGSILINGATRKSYVLAPPKKTRTSEFEFPVARIRPGDELVLGANTHFIVVAGTPD